MDKGLKLNPSKTDLLLIGYRLKKPVPDFSIGGTIIPRSHYVKYLGEVLDEKLNWNKHCEERVNKASKALSIARRITGLSWGLNPKMTFWMYKAMILPILSYGAIVWAKATEKSTRFKDMIQTPDLYVFTYLSKFIVSVPSFGF